MTPTHNRYFIAIIPPPAVFEEVTLLKEYFRDHYLTAAALRSPPHITLHMPFEWKAKKEEVLIETLKEFACIHSPVDITLNGFGSFPPRTIFIAVMPSKHLIDMQHDLHRFCKTRLDLFNARYRDLPYHAHLTIAFRDLKKQTFEKAWEEFRSHPFSAAFTTESLALLKHDGGSWRIFSTLQLSGNKSRLNE